MTALEVVTLAILAIMAGMVTRIALRQHQDDPGTSLAATKRRLDDLQDQLDRLEELRAADRLRILDTTEKIAHRLGDRSRKRREREVGDGEEEESEGELMARARAQYPLFPDGAHPVIPANQ